MFSFVIALGACHLSFCKCRRIPIVIRLSIVMALGVAPSPSNPDGATTKVDVQDRRSNNKQHELSQGPKQVIEGRADPSGLCRIG